MGFLKHINWIHNESKDENMAEIESRHVAKIDCFQVESLLKAGGKEQPWEFGAFRKEDDR